MLKLKGTVLMLVSMIIQIVLNLLILVLMPEIGWIILIDTVLIILTYIGFNNGVRGWAIFAVIYGILSMVLALSQGTLLNIGILVLVAGIVALTDK